MTIKFAAIGLAGVVMLTSSAAYAALDDANAQGVLKKAGCFACHALDKKILGPSYKDVAAKHKGESDAVAKLEKVIRAGSKGTYGSVAMPPNPASKIGNDELHSVAEWVLTK